MTTAFALDTPDLDQARELVGSLIAPFGLTPCRPAGYRARVRAGRIGALGVAEVSYRGAVDIASRVPADCMILEIPTDGQCRIAPREEGRRDDDRTSRRGDVIVSRPGETVHTWMGDGSRLLVLRVPVAALGALGNRPLPGSDARSACAGPTEGSWRPAPFLTMARLASVERLARLVFEESGPSGMLGDGDCAAELQHLVLALVGTLARPRPGPADENRSGVPLPRMVRQAQALMIAAPAGGLSIETLAAHCGVSLRSLQENFRAFAGTSPSDWWRGYRLDRVHAALLSARPGATVTETALAYGFHHLGRFAEQYRARFGEPPRETLRRATREGRGRP